MGIAPIDLQAIYANMNNVAKVASAQQQGVQLAIQLQESKMIQQNAEKAQTVHKTADNEAKSGTVRNDANGNSAQFDQNFEKKKDEKNQSQGEKASEIRESYLGQHINIER